MIHSLVLRGQEILRGWSCQLLFLLSFLYEWRENPKSEMTAAEGPGVGGKDDIPSSHLRFSGKLRSLGRARKEVQRSEVRGEEEKRAEMGTASL